MKCGRCRLENPEGAPACRGCGEPLPVSEETLVLPPEEIPGRDKNLLDGTIFAGRYRIVEKLGKGGMGVVYKAQDVKLKRFVALKFLPSWLTHDERFKQRFIQEAQAASALEHPNICTIHEIDAAEDGQMYISMAYYPGQTLKKMIERGPLPLPQGLDIVTQVAQGLAKSHGQGIVHRDIKPANIISTIEGVVKILDFGLAKRSGGEAAPGPGTLTGTVAYMSPEQARREDVDGRTDVWSLGVAFYETLTAALPFRGRTAAEVINRILHEAPIPPAEQRSEIPPEAERIILKCLEKDRERRYPSAERLLADLARLKQQLDLRAFEDILEKKRSPALKEQTERKQATLLSAEISGYEEILGHLGTEEAAALMSRCFARIGAIVHKYNGSLDKISGGAFLAVFGVPRAVEDAPKNAVNAAIELRRDLEGFNDEENLAVKLDLHAGIDTGWVVAGAIDTGAKKESSVMGDAVFAASTLKGLTAKGQIFVGGLAYRSTKNEFAYRKLRPLILKEKKEPLPVYELLSVEARVHRAVPGASRMIDSEMVGRDRDLATLRERLRGVLDGRGSIVNVSGEAGIGKSRLVAEFCQSEEMRNVRLLAGRALSIGRNLSFHPVIDLLKSWAGIKDDDRPDEALAKLEAKVGSVDARGGEEVVPFVGTMMGLKLSGPAEERIRGVSGEALDKIIIKSLRDLIDKIAAREPLVLILEDLHWADASSLDLLESLYRLAKTKPVLFVNVFRPNYEQTSDRILKVVRGRYGDIAAEISLDPLDEAQSEILISNLLNTKALPAKIKGLIARRAEGNPFFIEEVARTFIDEGVVERREGQVRITEKIESVVIPETINEVLMARIDKLDEDTRTLLKIAAVIGRNFFYKILAEVAAAVEDVDERLQFLKETQLIKEQVRMGEVEYLFKHALAQEAVYNSLLRKKRRQWHLEVARAIERVFRPRLSEFYGVLAYHFSLGEDADKAEEYLIKAGEEAIKSSASSEALHYCQEALRIYLQKAGREADPAKVAMLRKTIALAFFNKGRFNEAVESFDKVLSRLGERLPGHRPARAMKFAAGLARFLSGLYVPALAKPRPTTPKTREVIGIYEKKIRALATVDPQRMFLESFNILPRLIRSDLRQQKNGVGLFVISSALFCYSGISFGISRKILDRAEGIIDPDDERARLYYLFSKLIHHLVAGEWEEIEDYDEAVVDGGLKIGELWAATTYCLFSAWKKIAGRGSRGHSGDRRQGPRDRQHVRRRFLENDPVHRQGLRPLGLQEAGRSAGRDRGGHRLFLGHELPAVSLGDDGLQGPAPDPPGRLGSGRGCFPPFGRDRQRRPSRSHDLRDIRLGQVLPRAVPARTGQGIREDDGIPDEAQGGQGRRPDDGEGFPKGCLRKD